MLRETIKRLKTRTPRYFKMIRRGFIAMSTVGGLALSIKEDLPAFMQNIMPQMLTAGLVGTFLSSLPEEEKKEED